MRLKSVLSIVCILTLLCSTLALAQETEQDIVNRYLQKAEKQHTTKLGWAAASFSYNRINRNNDYNSFANVTDGQFGGSGLSWLDNAKAFGVEFGTIFKGKFAWSLGGEYWLKLGETISGTYTYTPPLGTAVQVTDPTSEIQVYGIYTGFQYYLVNPPDKNEFLKAAAVRIGGTVGYYGASWDLWQQFENLNLSTAMPEDQNTTFKGSAPGFTIGLGVDYPIKLANLALGADVEYLYLNFKNVAWYNSQDEEIIASFTGEENGRVDLGLSGVRARVQLKRFFSF